MLMKNNYTVIYLTFKIIFLWKFNIKKSELSRAARNFLSSRSRKFWPRSWKKSGDPIGIRTARPECRPLLLTSFKSSPLSVKELISRTSELIEFQSERFPISRATTSLRRRSTKIDNITPRIKNRIF